MERHSDTKYLYMVSKIKSDVLYVLMQLEIKNGCSKEEAALELKSVTSSLTLLETIMTERKL
ncbi:hypothetical protein [Paenibacillus sp. FSL L8-0506]|uniref:hypothetical protein n=1 Tax=Paenibacillus sp. FSL L8-0506 TaxID=2975335 RepID=UPI0030F5548A